MITDIERFVKTERPNWEELEAILDRMRAEPQSRQSLKELKRFHYLYERVSADLAKVATFSFERDVSSYLEHLVGRAYAEIHETRKERTRFAPLKWFFGTLPRTFRKHVRAFNISAVAILLGCMFGAGVIALDPDAKETIIPAQWYSNLDPDTRIQHEESVNIDMLRGRKTQGAAWYAVHNTRVSLMTFAAGMTYGIMTIISLFYNGVLLGAICCDYFIAGEGVFLIAWLLPHGSVEIPAIVIAGQAGLVLASALIGWGKRSTLKQRLRDVGPDIVTLMFGVALFLCWAGFVEAFLSQYHEPVVPYFLKITLGVIELILVALFLARAGRRKNADVE
jgi:uncharacterized membrane protein SpoIIM required for sporulation